MKGLCYPITLTLATDPGGPAVITELNATMVPRPSPPPPRLCLLADFFSCLFYLYMHLKKNKAFEDNPEIDMLTISPLNLSAQLSKLCTRGSTSHQRGLDHYQGCY